MSLNLRRSPSKSASFQLRQLSVLAMRKKFASWQITVFLEIIDGWSNWYCIQRGVISSVINLWYLPKYRCNIHKQCEIKHDIARMRCDYITIYWWLIIFKMTNLLMYMESWILHMQITNVYIYCTDIFHRLSIYSLKLIKFIDKTHWRPLCNNKFCMMLLSC